eukprot:2764085-Pleurochrysis_carterae.AAC.1
MKERRVHVFTCGAERTCGRGGERWTKPKSLLRRGGSKRACVRASVRASERACVRACVRASERACMRACVRACMRACVRAC